MTCQVLLFVKSQMHQGNSNILLKSLRNLEVIGVQKTIGTFTTWNDKGQFNFSKGLLLIFLYSFSFIVKCTTFKCTTYAGNSLRCLENCMLSTCDFKELESCSTPLWISCWYLTKVQYYSCQHAENWIFHCTFLAYSRIPVAYTRCM